MKQFFKVRHFHKDIFIIIFYTNGDREKILPITDTSMYCDPGTAFEGKLISKVVVYESTSPRSIHKDCEDSCGIPSA